MSRGWCWRFTSINKCLLKRMLCLNTNTDLPYHIYGSSNVCKLHYLNVLYKNNKLVTTLGQSHLKFSFDFDEWKGYRCDFKSVEVVATHRQRWTQPKQLVHVFWIIPEFLGLGFWLSNKSKLCFNEMSDMLRPLVLFVIFLNSVLRSNPSLFFPSSGSTNVFIMMDKAVVWQRDCH